ncbi:MAG TPA: RpiB/LacA/LacB family sugar-phosphate isomerase [Candidatus Paceibacterota bacterium]|nr:RpiB/LacA/LacB family sugar-phosphate isomerase [Verrucomicrobiota bacterium]HSA10950.1 RpiB/LacA/LacB family sugar-phosphate isomerase [Candidatus Paceibacterota bacterium]
MRVAFDCDDAGLPLKQAILQHLLDLGIDAVDLNLVVRRKADYPDIGYNLAKRVAAKEFDRGILVCGTGLGMAMVANKVEGVFAGTCHDVYSAERLCKSNAAQVLTLGARVVGPELAKTIISAWIHSRFEGGRSAPKVERMKELERQEFARGAGGGESARDPQASA